MESSLEIGDRRAGRRRSGVGLRQLARKLVGALLSTGAVRAHFNQRALVLCELLGFSLEAILEIAEVGGERAQIGLELTASIACLRGAWIVGGLGACLDRDGTHVAGQDACLLVRQIGIRGYAQRRRGDAPSVRVVEPLFRGGNIEHRQLGCRVEIHLVGCRVLLNVHRVSSRYIPRAAPAGTSVGFQTPRRVESFLLRAPEMGIPFLAECSATAGGRAPSPGKCVRRIMEI